MLDELLLEELDGVLLVAAAALVVDVPPPLAAADVPFPLLPAPCSLFAVRCSLFCGETAPLRASLSSSLLINDVA